MNELMASVRRKTCTRCGVTHQPKWSVCKGCGQFFVPKSGRTTKRMYCSRECAFAAKAQAAIARESSLEKLKPSRCVDCGCVVKKVAKRCSLCAIDYNRSSALLASCNKYQENRRRRSCIDCGTVGQCKKYSYRCDACTVVNNRKAKSRVRKRAKAVRKLRIKGFSRESELIDSHVIYERDGWMCQLCGKRIKRNADANEPLAPSLDHIVPLAKGGTHTAKNVQCAHRSCNTMKQDRMIGQLRLW